MDIEPFDEKNYMLCSLCSSNNHKTVVITDPILDEMICQNCGQVISDKELQTSLGPVRIKQGSEHNNIRDELSTLWRVMIWGLQLG